MSVFKQQNKADAAKYVEAKNVKKEYDAPVIEPEEHMEGEVGFMGPGSEEDKPIEGIGVEE